MGIKVRILGRLQHLAHKDFGELVSIGADVMKHVVEVAEKPTTLNVVKATFNIWKILESSRTFAEEYFHPNWSFPYDRQFAGFIVGAISDYPLRVLRTADEDVVVKIANVNGEEIGWTSSTSENTVNSGVYVKDDRFEESKAAIKKALWDKVSHRAIVMEKMPPQGDQKYSEGINFKKDDDLVGLQSKTADNYADQLRRFMEKGITRTVLFYGRPGTGKSTIAQAIADRLNLKTLRIRVEDIADFDNNVIFEAINVFEPDVIILDDLDRSMSQSHLLETMTRFHKHVKLVFATVNHRDALDEALMRPGRFDMIEHIRALDDEVVMKMLGKENEDLLETMRDWPIAFIEEYATRRKVMSKEEAVNSIRELQKRVNRLGSADDEEDEDEDLDEEEPLTDEDVAGDEELMSLVDDGNESAAAAEVPEFVKRYLKKIKITKARKLA